MLLRRSGKLRCPLRVATSTNPWLPWVEPDCGTPQPDRGAVLSIIPTAGRDLPRLQQCLAALRRAAGGVRLRTVLVVCPAEAANPKVDRLGPVLSLPGPFNFPRSVNAGLEQLRDEELVLLLNDDCLLESGSLAQLRSTLRARRWAAIGPHLPGWQGSAGRIERQNAPVTGACVLWERSWLERLGPFDEQFGQGYGFDESDQSLRALRQGATWGVDGMASARHAGHATFGSEAPRGPLWHENRERWRAKWGDLDFWGQGIAWEPLPGISVTLAGHNVRPWLERCLRSLEASLVGFRWGLAYADDGSTDGGWELVQELAPQLGADWLELERYPKAAAVGGAKNRALRLAGPHLGAYPAVFMMDADDVMRRERPTELLWRVRDGGHRLAHGAWLACGEAWNRGHLEVPTLRQQRHGNWSPCTSVVHASLIPADGRLSCEELPAFEDAEWVLRLWLRGIVSTPIPAAGAVHEYWVRPGSCHYGGDRQEKRRLWEARRNALVGLSNAS